MPQTKEQKKKIVDNLKEKIEKQKSMVFVAFEGLKAKDLFNLRKKLKESDCKLIVAKKTMFDLAFKNRKLDFDKKGLKGQIGLVFGFEDEVAPAKIVYKFSIDNKNLKILGGYLENKFKGIEDMLVLAKIPSKPELLARIVGSMNAPVANFANALRGNLRSLVYILSEIKK